MKFLCLHGNGTNSNVMKLQIAPLVHELSDGHAYEFVEAAKEAPMSEGVETVSSPEDRFFAYFDPSDLTTLTEALKQLDNYVTVEGPFDAIMGFSAGAVLAAAYLIEKQRQGGPQPFGCSIFLSSASSKAEMGHLHVDVKTDMIRIPTAHIWGSLDQIAPTGGHDLSVLCEPAERLTLVHDGGHEPPRKSHLTESVHVIRRTLLRAQQ